MMDFKTPKLKETSNCSTSFAEAKLTMFKLQFCTFTWKVCGGRYLENFLIFAHKKMNLYLLFYSFLGFLPFWKKNTFKFICVCSMNVSQLRFGANTNSIIIEIHNVLAPETRHGVSQNKTIDKIVVTGQCFSSCRRHCFSICFWPSTVAIHCCHSLLCSYSFDKIVHYWGSLHTVHVSHLDNTINNIQSVSQFIDSLAHPISHRVFRLHFSNAFA